MEASIWYGATLITEYPNQASILGKASMKLVDLENSSNKEAIGLGITGLRVKVGYAFYTIREMPFLYISGASKFKAKITGKQMPGVEDNTCPSKLRFIPYNKSGVEQTRDIIEIELDPSKLSNSSMDIEVKLNKSYNYRVIVEFKNDEDYYIITLAPVGLQSNIYYIYNWTVS